MIHTVFYITPSVELLGARISLVELLKNLDKTRFHPVVVCPKPGPLVDKLNEIGVDNRIIRFGNWRKVKYWPLIPGAIYNITEAAREENISLWHSNEFWAFPYAYLSARRLNIPTICHFRCSRPPAQLPAHKLKNYYVHKADRIISVSKAQHILFKDIPEVKSKLIVIPNGVDYPRFQQGNGADFRREIGINGNEFLVGIVGPVSEHKGVEEFLHAASIIVKQIPNTRFAVVGPDRPKNFGIRMHQLAEELNLQNQIIFTGFRRDIASVMAGLDILVTPSRVEAFGRVLLEAMAAGTPVVASHVGGIPEIISDPDFGILVPPQYPDLFADQIIQLLTNEDRRKTIARNAQRHINEHFTIQLHALKVQDIYDEVLLSFSQQNRNE